MNAFHELVEYFRQFPGIGPRQAKRFVYYLLSKDEPQLSKFSELIQQLKKEIRICDSCFRFFGKNGGRSASCSICTDPNRDHSSLMIISRDVDLENIEKSGSYSGLYFVLGGSIPILTEDPENKIRLKPLIALLEKRSSDLKEIILAMNLNAEGENTEDFLRNALDPYTKKSGIKVSTLGRGLSTGTELEYSDSDTIKNALKNRQIQ